jgi:BASS family bile acid:Na+ symporter
MNDALQLLARLSVPVFVVSSMLAMGLRLTPRAVLAPLRNPRLVAITLLVNFFFAPAAAYLLTMVVPLDRSYAAGLLLLSVAAGAPFLPKLTEAARGDPSLSVAVMSLLTGGTILFMPFAVPLLVPGFNAGAWVIAKPLLLTMVLPLITAMCVRMLLREFAERCRPILSVISTASLLLLMLLLIGLNLNALIGIIGSGAIAVSAVFLSVTFAAGYSLGGATADERGVLGLAAVARNVAAALPVAAAHGDPKVIVMLLACTLTGLVLSLLVISRLRRSPRHDRPPPDAAGHRTGATTGGTNGRREIASGRDAISSPRR